MKRAIVAAVAASVLLLSGCAAKVIASNERMVLVEAPLSDPGGALRMAESECIKFDRHARLSSRPIYDTTWAFDCLK
jgi:hypothetical protein